MGPAVGRAAGPEGGSGAAETATGRGAAAVTCGRDDGSQSARRTPPRAGSALCQEARRAARGRCWGMARIGGQWRRRCAVGGRRDGRAAGRATSDGHGRGKATARAQRNGGGKRADILRDAERHGTSWHSPPGRRARGHRATERRTAPRASAPEPRYTIGGIRESGTPSVAQPACSLLTQCAAMQCAPGSLGDQPLPVPSDSILILAAIGASKPWRQGQGAAQWTDSQPSSSALDAKHGRVRSLPRFRTRREHVAGCLKPPRNDGTSAGPLKKYRR